MESKEQVKDVIVIDGIEYPVQSLSPEVQGLAQLYWRWEAEAQETRVNLMKIEYAMQGVADQIIAAVKGADKPAGQVAQTLS